MVACGRLCCQTKYPVTPPFAVFAMLRQGGEDFYLTKSVDNFVSNGDVNRC